FVQVIDSAAGQYRVGTVGNHLGGAVVLEGFSGFAQRACGVDHVIHENAGAAFHFADDMHDLGHVGFRAALVDDGEVAVVQLFGDGAGADDAADVGGHYHQVLIVLLFNIFQ